MGKGARFTLDQLGPDARRQAMEQLWIGIPGAPPNAASAVLTYPGSIPDHVVGKRMRQDSKPLLNKLETRYRDEMLYPKYKPEDVVAQGIRLRLSNGHWYKADFFVRSLGLFIEVKGPKSFRGGFENLKDAACHYPNFKFRLVWLPKRNGPWHAQEVLP